MAHPDNPDETTLPPAVVENLKKMVTATEVVNASTAEEPLIRKFAEEFIPLFDAGVDFLRSDKFPNKQINELAQLFFKLVGNRIVPAALAPEMQTIGFMMYQGKAMIAIPVTWPALVRANKWYAYGSLVFCASQARDYFNQRITLQEKPNVVSRGRVYEAEYLLEIQKLDPSYRMNDYQKTILREFPEGLDTPGFDHLKYKSRLFPTFTDT